MNFQFQAGFLIESVKEFLLDTNPDKKEEIRRLYYLLSHFDVNSNVDLSNVVENPDPLLAIVNNLITRGLPEFRN